MVGRDYVAQEGEVVFGQTQTTRTIQVPVVGDRYAEPAENFDVRLDASEGATRTDLIGVVTINDPDVCTHVVAPDNLPLNGSSGDDVLCGDERDNRLNGKEGNDTLIGYGGKDILDPDLGNDRVVGGSGVPLRDGADDVVWYRGLRR